MTLFLDGDFDGGNPKETDSVLRAGENEFIVRPFSEDEDPNYKFRLDLKLRNDSSLDRRAILTLDWKTEKFMELRDYVFLKDPGAAEWSYIPGKIEGTKTRVELDAKPGESHVCLHPAYSYGDYMKLIGSIPDSGPMERILLGESREGRKIWAIRISDPSRPARRNLLAVARIHPYETAGSYCAEGIVESFRFPSARERSVLEKFNVYLVPMISPDGVYHGFGKLTSRQGVDLSKNADAGDASGALLKALIDDVKPAVYIEFHNWMFKDVDGIYYLGALESCRFARRMPSQKKYGKAWKPMLRRKILSVPPPGFKKYCRDRYRSVCACFEYPWFLRDIPAMKAMGGSTIYAVSGL